MKKLNKLLLAVLMVMTAFTASAWDDGDLSYEVFNSSKKLVNCTGLSSAGRGKTNLALTIPGTVTYNGTTYRVFKITENAFASQSNLSSVTIKWGVKIISNGAFNATNITELKMPSSVQYVGSNAFVGCSKLKDIYYSSYDTKPYTNLSAWDNNGSGKTLYLPKHSTLSASDITGMSCWANFTINKNKEDVYDWHVGDCYWCVPCLGSSEEQNPSVNVDMVMTGADPITSIAIGYASTSMTTSNTTFVFKKVAAHALDGRSSITKIDLDNCTQMTEIGAYAFQNCTALTTLKIPKSVTILNAASCIDGCTSLAAVTINSANTNYANHGSTGAIFSKSLQTLYRVPEGNSYEFLSNNWPTALKYVENYAFWNCKKVTRVFLPYGLKTIGSQAFNNCTNLSQLLIPSSVTTLSSNALSGAKISYCNVNLKTAPTVTGVGSITNLYVPYGATNEYTSAKGWSPSYLNYGGQQAFDYDYNNIFYTVTTTVSTTANNGTTYAGRVKVVCDGATYNKSSATTVNIPTGVTIAGKSYAVTRIGEDAFNANTGNITVTGCLNIDTVAAYAFQNQPLVSYPFTHGLEGIGTAAFYGTKLSGTIILPYGVGDVDSEGFKNCTSITRLLFPSTIWWIGTNAIEGCSSMSELIFNNNRGISYTQNASALPSTCKILVPTGMVNQYKQHSNWSSRSSYVTAGAYDFAWNNSYNSYYHLTITSNSPVTYNGITYAGKAKYVYHPSNTNKTDCGWATSETDETVSGDSRKYLITEIGDSCLVGAKTTTISIPESVTRIGHDACYNVSTLTTNNLVLPNGLTFIGANAFRGTGLKGEIKIPSTVTTIEHDAFWGVSSLTALYFPDDINYSGLTLGNDAWYSGSNLTVWVPNQHAYKYLTEANKWGSSRAERLAVYIKPYYTSTMFSSVVPTDLAGSGINAYYASNYDKNNTGKEITLTKANKAPANMGLLLVDLTSNVEKRINRPTGTISEPTTNYFVAANTSNVNVASVTGGVGYYWKADASPVHFVKPTSSYYVGPTAGSGGGYSGQATAYLKLSTSEAGTLTDVFTSLYPGSVTPSPGVPGDYNGDDKVDITDVNAVINMMIGKLPYKAICDMDNNNRIDISDVNAVINKMLGK